MVNREHMEQWINALEAYDREPARGTLVDHGTLVDARDTMCAVGIGMNVMRPGFWENITRAVDTWSDWIGVWTEDEPFDVPLKSDGSAWATVIEANDNGKQSPWTIAQRLRETYLKEES